MLKDGSIRLANDTLQQSLSDAQVVGGLVDIVCIFWMSRCQELADAKNAEYRSLLEKKSAKILTLLFRVYKTSFQVHRSVIYLCSFLPTSKSSTIASFCLSRLRSGCDDESGFSTYVDALCNWRRGDDLLDLILVWINGDLKERQLKESGEFRRPLSKRQSKGVRFVESNEKPRPEFAIHLLNYLLSHSLNKAILLKKNMAQLEEIQVALKVS